MIYGNGTHIVQAPGYVAIRNEMIHEVRVIPLGGSPEFTVHDRVIYTRPWTVRFELDSQPGYEVYEYACHEGNYGLANMLSAARAEERAAEEGH